METKQKQLGSWKEQVELLSQDQQQLLKDTIRYGGWGDGQESFLNPSGEIEEDWFYGYCTNEAKRGGHFSGRQISAMFSQIIRKLCPKNGIGVFFSHCSDWWGDGTGDMFFVRHSISDEVEQWAAN